MSRQGEDEAFLTAPVRSCCFPILALVHHLRLVKAIASEATNEKPMPASPTGQGNAFQEKAHRSCSVGFVAERGRPRDRAIRPPGHGPAWTMDLCPPRCFASLQRMRCRCWRRHRSVPLGRYALFRCAAFSQRVTWWDRESCRQCSSASCGTDREECGIDSHLPSPSEARLRRSLPWSWHQNHV